MENEELQQARTNPEFLAYLDTREKEVIEDKNIAGLYEVLDTLLVLDLDHSRINKVYEEILKVSFDNIEQRLQNDKKLDINTDDIYFIRSFYEHAIEKWSVLDFKGAKELFFILTQIVEDSKLVDAFNIHLLSCSKKLDMDTFYDKKVIHDHTDSEDRYGYFITHFQFDIEDYMKTNKELLEKEYKALEHLLK